MSGSRVNAELVIRLAVERGARLALAESLTGGMLVAALIDVPGASQVVSGGIVAYDAALKHSLLGVDEAILDEVGPVDAEVARQMAYGVREACAAPDPATIGVATTGVAGPEPDAQTGQPVGTVWLGISSARGDRAILLQLSGDRAEIRSKTVAAALESLIEELTEI